MKIKHLALVFFLAYWYMNIDVCSCFSKEHTAADYRHHGDHYHGRQGTHRDSHHPHHGYHHPGGYYHHVSCFGTPSPDPVDGSFTWNGCRHTKAKKTCTATCGDGYNPSPMPPKALCTARGTWTLLGGACEPSAATRCASGQESVTAGFNHACAALDDGTARCWGSNGSGGLGDNSTTPSLTPVQVVGLTGVKSISAGYLSSCAALNDGTVRCWGKNDYGQLGDNTTIDRQTPVQVVGLTCVKSVMTAASTGRFACAVLDDGTARCWGSGANGQLGNNATVPEVLAPAPVLGLSGVKSISGASFASCGVLVNGSAVCWGFNSYGQLGINATYSEVNQALTPRLVVGLTRAKSISAGSNHFCAALRDGTVRCWGDNSHGQLGNNNTEQQIAPVQVIGLTDVETVGLGDNHSCAVLKDGTARCWGQNNAGGLGNNSTLDSSVPVVVTGLTGASCISGGASSTCAALVDGTARCWGVNYAGQLGDGTTIDRLTPVQVVNITDVCRATNDATAMEAMASVGRMKLDL